ncbi:MAG: hypothetical protein ABEJ31_09080 [Haloarculaceae archaeon]
MPIRDDEFESGVTDEADRAGVNERLRSELLEYLEVYDDEAFTARELAHLLAAEQPGQNLDEGIVEHVMGLVGELTPGRRDAVADALADLVARGEIESREVDTGHGTRTYYRAADGE